MLPLLLACATVPPKAMVDATMEDEHTRKATIEKVLRTLDEHPEYDDDVYAAAKNHPKTFARMVELAGHDLEDKTFADSTTAIVVKDPAATAQTMVSAVEQFQKLPATIDAVNQALSKHSDLMVSLVDHDRPTLDALIEAELRAADKDEKARGVLLDVLIAASPHLLELVARDPKILGQLTEAFLRAGLHDKESLKEMFKKIVD